MGYEANGPEEVHDIELISMDELHAIRHIWISEKHDTRIGAEDSSETMGSPFPADGFDDQFPFDATISASWKKNPYPDFSTSSA